MIDGGVTFFCSVAGRADSRQRSQNTLYIFGLKTQSYEQISYIAD